MLRERERDRVAISLCLLREVLCRESDLMLWQLQASHIRFLVAITWVTRSERTPNTLPETNSNLTPEIDPTRKRSYSNHQWYICRLFQPATAVAVQVISTTLSEDWTVWSWMQIEFISKESMATQALSYSPAPHHPSIASIHSQIKMSSGKIYLQKKSTAKPIGVTGIGQTGNIWSETSMLYTWCFGEKNMVTPSVHFPPIVSYE